MNKEIIQLVKSKKYYEELYDIPWRMNEGKKLPKQTKLRIGFN